MTAMAVTSFGTGNDLLTPLAPLLRHGGSMVYQTLIASGLLAVTGIVMICLRPSMMVRLAYSVLTLVPVVLGLSGALIGGMKSFANLGIAGLRDGSMYFAILGELSAYFILGLLGSAVAMTLAAVLWLMPVKKAAPPPLPG